MISNKFNLNLMAIFLVLFTCSNTWAQLQTVRTYDVSVVIVLGNNQTVFENTIHPEITLTTDGCSKYRYVNNEFQSSPNQNMNKAFFDKIGLNQEVYNPFYDSLEKIKKIDLQKDYYYPKTFNLIITAMSSLSPTSDSGKIYAKWNKLADDRKKLIKQLVLTPSERAAKVKTLNPTEKELYAILANSMLSIVLGKKQMDEQVELASKQQELISNADQLIYSKLKEFIRNQVVPDCDKKKL